MRITKEAGVNTTPASSVFVTTQNDQLYLMRQINARMALLQDAIMENDMLLGMISLGDVAVCASNADTEIAEALTEISKPTNEENE